MSSSFGTTITVSTFGTSHGHAIGAIVDGLPCGFTVDMKALEAFIARRAPGKSQLHTQRKEADIPQFLSGIVDNTLSGSPLAFQILNTSHHSQDYQNLQDIPRPSHADYTARLRYGDHVDMRGGGHFSGRLTAPICVAGGIALQILKAKGITVAGHIKQLGPIVDTSINMVTPDIEALVAISGETIPMVSPKARTDAETLITHLRQDCDSIGGIIQVVVTGFPKGIGNPNYDGLENRLAKTVFGVPAVKGISFGSGFAGCLERGSEQNDPFTIVDGTIRTTKNNSGGIQGGISNGMPLIMQVGIKPTASIFKPQQSVSLEGKTEKTLIIKGRHDPCIVLRAVPVMEAITALVLLDFLAPVHEYNNEP